MVESNPTKITSNLIKKNHLGSEIWILNGSFSFGKKLEWNVICFLFLEEVDIIIEADTIIPVGTTNVTN